MTYADTYTKIEAIISQTRGDSDRFAETLRHQGIQHISFSQIAAVEACPHRYYLQYICLLDPMPMPSYFTKGKLFHQALARSYQGQMEGQAVGEDALCQIFDGECEGDTRLHLHNAVQVHLANRWADFEVVAIEHPFVLQLDEDLPPVVGVIDLILRHNSDFVVIDHKTGRDFYAPDVLQMAVYGEYIRRTYGDPACDFYYDQYRWVRNLARIRKPAFERKQVLVQPDMWQQSLARLRHGSAAIDTIRTTNDAPKSGECFRCPYRSVCWD